MGDATNTNKFPGFKKCIEFINSDVQAIQEDGYFWLLDSASNYVDEFILLIN